jgi:hypothetical protein
MSVPLSDLPSRQFADIDGVEWRVIEMSMASVDHGTNPRRQHFWDRWLTFSSPVGKFRLAPVPDGWPTSSPELLRRWLANARLAAESRRGVPAAAAPRPLPAERSGSPARPAADGDAARAQGPATPSRTFHDILGRVWEVREEHAPSIPNPPAAHCLVFDCGIITRRVWEYPPDWRSLPDPELERVSRRR